MTLASHPCSTKHEFTATATLIQKLAEALERGVQVTEFTDGTIAIVDTFSQEWRKLLKSMSSDVQLLSSEWEHAKPETQSEGLRDVLDAIVTALSSRIWPNPGFRISRPRSQTSASALLSS